jgi:hypothetical protein
MQFSTPMPETKTVHPDTGILLSSADVTIGRDWVNGRYIFAMRSSISGHLHCGSYERIECVWDSILFMLN